MGRRRQNTVGSHVRRKEVVTMKLEDFQKGDPPRDMLRAKCSCEGWVAEVRLPYAAALMVQRWEAHVAEKHSEFTDEDGRLLPVIYDEE